MEKGSIFYDTEKNIYHLITTDVQLENVIGVMLITGYQTKHEYIASTYFACDYYENHDERYVQVGGIY